MLCPRRLKLTVSLLNQRYQCNSHLFEGRSAFGPSTSVLHLAVLHLAVLTAFPLNALDLASPAFVVRFMRAFSHAVYAMGLSLKGIGRMRPRQVDPWRNHDWGMAYISGMMSEADRCGLDWRGA